MAEQPRIFIIIPTYNERDNIIPLVEQLLKLDIQNLSVIIVDDSSPDGTGVVADKLARTHPAVSVIHRPRKEGLGPAYVAGFTLARNRGADFFIQMDADLSHNPERIPALLDGANNADLVIGSRYIQGGHIENWNYMRKLISYFGNFYARLVLGVPVKDLTSGFKCYRRQVLECIGLRSLSSLGYVFQIETTYKTIKAGFTVTEIPITFTERKIGSSNFNAWIFIEAFCKVLALRFKKHQKRNG